MKVFIYEDDPSTSLDIENISTFLKSFGFEVVLRGDFFEFINFERSHIDSFLNSIKINDFESPLDDNRLPNKNDNIQNKKEQYSFKGTLYDGFWLQRKLYSLICHREKNVTKQNSIHIIFTRKLFGTYGVKRYHARVLLTGVPSIISTSGIVEAPARPREYYFAKASFLQSSRSISELDELFKGRFIDYDDPRISNIACSYTLQAIKSFLNGEPFCSDTKCSLYNSHWQKELIELQYSRVLCKDCQDILNI